MPSPDRWPPVPGPPAGVLVLGMHRSGTSAATRLVNLLGPSTCIKEDLLGVAPGNPTGLWESGSLVTFNDELLARVGRAWWCPPLPGERYWSAFPAMGPSDAGREAFAAVHPGAPWVWKDPRTALTLPYWRRALDRAVVALV